MKCHSRLFFFFLIFFQELHRLLELMKFFFFPLFPQKVMIQIFGYKKSKTDIFAQYH